MATHYHIHHHPFLETIPAFESMLIDVPTIADRRQTEPMLLHSLRNDMAKLREMGAAKGIVDPTVVSIGASAQGRELYALRMGKVSKHRVLFAGCHHAKEWISVEIPFLVAKYLIDNYTREPSAEDADEATLARQKRIKHLLENREIWFVPMVNPDGHFYTMTKDRNWRSNRKKRFLEEATITAQQYGGANPDGEPTREIEIAAGGYYGVDINRNYPTLNWGQETYGQGRIRTSRNPLDGANETWTGPWPASENEVKAMVALIRRNAFKASISYHSYAKYLTYDKFVAGAAFLQDVGNGMLQLLNEGGAAEGFAYEYVCGDTKMYPITGHFGDFCFEQSPGQPTFTNELAPHDNDPNCKAWAFSGLPDHRIDSVFQENLASALALINSAGFSQPAGAQRICADEATHTVQVVDNCWEVFAGWPSASAPGPDGDLDGPE